MKLEHFDRETVRNLREALNEVLSDFGGELGIEFTFENISYSEESFTTKLKCVIPNVDGSNPVNEIDWNRNCLSYGLKKEFINETFSYRQSTYKIITILTRSRKYPILCQNLTKDTKVKFTASLIQDIFQNR